MNLKAVVHLNRIKIPYIDGFDKVTKYFAQHDVFLDFTYKKVDVKGYTSTYEAPLKRWLILGTEKLIKLEPDYDINIFVFDQNEWKTRKGSKYPLKPETPSGCCYMLNGKPYITIGLHKEMDHIQVAHELMHALAFIKRAKDVMDTYRENESWNSPTGNFSEQWKELDNVLKIVVINRISDDGVQTLGNLIFENFRCKTLERSWKNNKRNISCIPSGAYYCKFTFSPKFLKYTYELTDVPERSGIRVHSGNFWFDVQGCILLGNGYTDINKDKYVDVTNSKETVRIFEQLLGKKDFILVINDK